MLLNIIVSYHDNYHDKDNDSTFVIYIVNENNQWKIYKGKEEFRGNDIEDSAMAKEAYDYWVEIGNPRS